MLVRYRNQAYKHNHYMFCLLFCIIQVISSNVVRDPNNINKDFNNEKKVNKTGIDPPQIKVSLVPNASKTEELLNFNNLNSTNLKEKEEDSIYEQEKKKLFHNYSLYEKSDWESFIINSAHKSKNNSTLISDLRFNVFFEKQKIKLLLVTLNSNLNSTNTTNKEILLRSLSILYNGFDLSNLGNDKTIFFEKLISKYFDNTLVKMRGKYNEDFKTSQQPKRYLLKFNIRVYMNSVLISSENSFESSLNSEVDLNFNKDKGILAFLKRIFKHEKKNYLAKEDFLKSASPSYHNKDGKSNDRTDLSNVHYFKFKESIAKSKRILDSNPNAGLNKNQNQNLNQNLKENLDLEYQLQNPFLPSSNKHNNKLRIQKNSLSNSHKQSKNDMEIPNPCFLKGYYSNKTKIKGSGSYTECFKQFNDSLGSKFAQMEDLSQNKTSVLLGSDFKDIADIIASENTTIQNFNLLAEQICAADYAAIRRKYFFIANVDNICFKLCYASVVFSKLFKNNEKTILIFSTNIRNISPEAENEIIMSNYFNFQAESIPPWILVVFVLLILSFFTNYFLKDQIISVLKKMFYKNELIYLCLKRIRRSMLSGKEDKEADLSYMGPNANGNVNKSMNMRNSRVLNASQNNAGDHWLRKEESDRDSIAHIIDLVREQDDEFKEYFDNKFLSKDNCNNNINNNYNDHYNYNNNNNNHLSLVNEYPVKNKESNKHQSSFYNNNNNNNNNHKNQSSSDEDIFYQKFNNEMNLANSDEKKDILDTLINSLPVKNFLYTVLLKKIKDLCEREIFLSFSEFKLFFYGEVEHEIQLKLVILQTIEKRNQLKATKVFCLVQILLAILLSILTNKIFSFITFNNNYIQGVIIVLFSFLYMTLLIMECLILITLIDYEKYYYSNILTQSEKLFLEQEFSVEPNHNNELF